MKFNLPKPYLSYSAFALWIKDKNAFRKRYYENVKPFETAETIFGKKVHEHLENTRIGREKRIEVELVPGLKLLGYIDEFNEETLEISDDKTGHLDAKGKPPWNAVKVRKHKQLVFYELLVLIAYGKFNPVTQLRWIETRFKVKNVEFDGHVLGGKTKELELTGREVTFKRRIYKWEIENLEKEIINAAEEISKDYTQWTKK